MAVYCGHVYVLYLPIAGKEKLLVPAYALPDGRVRFFVINTKRTQFQQDKPHIASHVLPLKRGDNPEFLTRDSWLTCNEVVAGWTVAEIDTKPDCYRAPLDQATLAKVKILIADSRLFSEFEKTAILNQWP